MACDNPSLLLAHAPCPSCVGWALLQVSSLWDDWLNSRHLECCLVTAADGKRALGVSHWQERDLAPKWQMSLLLVAHWPKLVMWPTHTEPGNAVFHVSWGEGGLGITAEGPMTNRVIKVAHLIVENSNTVLLYLTLFFLVGLRISSYFLGQLDLLFCNLFVPFFAHLSALS